MKFYGKSRNFSFYNFFSKKFTQNSKKVFVTTPIFYVNSKPHIGHLYSAILASAVKQVHLLNGNPNVILTTGTDEHGLKVQQKAKEEKVDTQLFCDKNSALFKNLFDSAKIDYDDYIRTSDSRHKEYVRKFWLEMMEKSKIYKKEYHGYYSVQEESFVPEKDLIKKGDKFYTSLSIHSNQAVEYTKEQNYQIKFENEDISSFNSLIETQKLEFIPKSLSNEVKHYCKNVSDLCVSRPKSRVAWGIPVPNDEEHIMYVWFEALLNYLTIAQNHISQGKDFEFIHIIGKDISKFHCYIWPLLLLLNKSFPCKITILMHNYWLKNETKMSKSIGNVIDPEAVIKKYGADAIRFYFLAAGPLLHDVSYEEKALTNVFYRNIPDTFINLILRLTTNKVVDANKYNRLNEFSEEYKEKIKENMKLVESAVTELLLYNFIQAAHYIHLILLNLNNLVQVSEFWKKLDNEQLIREVTCLCLEFLRIVTILYTPFLPELMRNVGRYLGMKEDNFNFKNCKFRSSHEINEDKNSQGYFYIDSEYKSKIFINKVK